MNNPEWIWGLLDCCRISCFIAEVVEKLRDALFAIGVISEGVNDPNLIKASHVKKKESSKKFDWNGKNWPALNERRSRARQSLSYEEWTWHLVYRHPEMKRISVILLSSNSEVTYIRNRNSANDFPGWEIPKTKGVVADFS